MARADKGQEGQRLQLDEAEDTRILEEKMVVRQPWSFLSSPPLERCVSVFSVFFWSDPAIKSTVVSIWDRFWGQWHYGYLQTCLILVCNRLNGADARETQAAVSALMTLAPPTDSASSPPAGDSIHSGFLRIYSPELLELWPRVLSPTEWFMLRSLCWLNSDFVS